MSAAQSVQQNNRGPGGQYSFGTHAEPQGVALAAEAPLQRTHGQRTFSVEGAGEEPGKYSIFEDGNEVAYFTAATDPRPTPDELWAEALTEMQQNDVIEICSECTNALDDGEGYDGKCGDCADRAYGGGCDNQLEDGEPCEHCSETISEFEQEHRGAALTVVREDHMDTDCFEVRDAEGNEILTFIHSGDPQDHDSVWESAETALQEHADHGAKEKYGRIPDGAEVINEPHVSHDSDGEPIVGARYVLGNRESIVVSGEHGAVELWRTPSPDADSFGPMDQHYGGLELHSRKPAYDGQKQHEGCPNTESGTCYPSGSSMAYDHMRFAFAIRDNAASRALNADYESLKSNSLG